MFGGGHVILPLLRAEVVPNGWVGDNTFLAGYGAAQALPGPLFTFAGFLGTSIYSGSNGWFGGLWCLFAIFLPAWLLIAGALPFWHQLRAKTWTQAALRGANAACLRSSRGRQNCLHPAVESARRRNALAHHPRAAAGNPQCERDHKSPRTFPIQCLETSARDETSQIPGIHEGRQAPALFRRQAIAEPDPG